MDENDKQLLDNIRGNPDDPLPKGIYADWLEEQGRADYATFIRLSLEGELDDEQSALLRTVYERSLSLDRDGDEGQKARENAWFHGTGLTGTTRFEGNKISLHISPSPSSDRTFINPFVLADRFEEVARLVKAPCFYFSSVSISVGFLEGAFSVGYISPYDVRGIVRAYADNVDMYRDLDVTLRLRSGEPVHYGEALELVLSMHDEELWDYEREALEYVRDVLPHLRFYDVASIGIESDTIGVLYGFQAFSEDQREVLGGAPPFSKCRNVSLSIPELYSHVHLLEITEIFPALENLRFYASDLAHPTFVEHIEDGMVQPPSMEEVLDGPKLRIEMVQPDGETLVYGRFDDPPAAGLVDFGGGPPAP